MVSVLNDNNITTSTLLLHVACKNGIILDERPQNGYSGTPLKRPPLGPRILAVVKGWP